VAIYNSHDDAVTTVNELQQSDCDSLKLSIVDQRTENSCDRYGHQFVGIYNIGIPILFVLRYETALKVNKFIVIAQGSEKDVANGREMISNTNPESVDEHQFSPSDATPGLRA
jgi:hypothetical protein